MSEGTEKDFEQKGKCSYSQKTINLIWWFLLMFQVLL